MKFTLKLLLWEDLILKVLTRIFVFSYDLFLLVPIETQRCADLAQKKYQDDLLLHLPFSGIIYLLLFVCFNHKMLFKMLYWNLLSAFYLTKPFCLRLRYAFFPPSHRLAALHTSRKLRILTFWRRQKKSFFPSIGSGRRIKLQKAKKVSKSGWDSFFKINSNK